MSDIIRKPAGAPGSTGGQFDGRTRTAAGGSLSLVDEYGAPSLPDLYARWRRVERASCDVRIVKYVPEYHFSDLSPMHWFVQSTTGSVQGFAKQLKVQTATILSYTTGKQKDMPHPLREALVDAGYAHIGTLEKLQNDWNKNNAE